MAISSFKDERLAAILARRSPKRFPADLLAVTRRILVMLAAAQKIEELRAPPAHRREALKGDRAGPYSIRVTDQFRLSFVWTNEGPAEVEFVDDHRGKATTDSKLAPVHPGEILREELLLPLNLSAGAVARAIGVPRTRIERLATE